MIPINIDRRISFPCGGGGNHVVNILSLDHRFNSVFKTLGVADPTIKNKLAFFENEIYTKSRTWFNWLEYEWKTRPTFGRIVKIIHEYYDWEIRTNNSRVDNIPKGSKILLLKFDNLQLLLDHYWHINLGLNSMTPEKFINIYKQWYAELAIIENRNFDECLVANGEILHQAKLDEEFYNRICDWFEFDRHYEAASKIHDMWVSCRIQSAKDFSTWFKGDEFQSYLQRMENFQLT